MKYLSEKHTILIGVGLAMGIVLSALNVYVLTASPAAAFWKKLLWGIAVGGLLEAVGFFAGKLAGSIEVQARFERLWGQLSQVR